MLADKTFLSQGLKVFSRSYTSDTQLINHKLHFGIGMKKKVIQ